MRMLWNFTNHKHKSIISKKCKLNTQYTVWIMRHKLTSDLTNQRWFNYKNTGRTVCVRHGVNSADWLDCCECRNVKHHCSVPCSFLLLHLITPSSLIRLLKFVYTFFSVLKISTKIAIKLLAAGVAFSWVVPVQTCSFSNDCTWIGFVSIFSGGLCSVWKISIDNGKRTKVRADMGQFGCKAIAKVVWWSESGHFHSLGHLFSAHLWHRMVLDVLARSTQTSICEIHAKQFQTTFYVSRICASIHRWALWCRRMGETLWGQRRKVSDTAFEMVCLAYHLWF